jgi:DNA-binding transcriptional LysR family regulator
MPELAQLRTFIAVADALSFTRAAETLGMSQQGVSKAVRALEDELDVVLLERTTREVTLTPAGSALVDAGRDLLARTDAAVAHVRSVASGLAGTVRVGLTPAVGHADRIEVAGALRADSPGLHVALLNVRPSQLRRMLRSGELDLALSRARGLDDPTISTRALRPTPMVLCVPVGHRLAAESEVPLRAIDGERLLVASAPGTAYTDLLLERLAEAGAHVTPVEAHVTGGEAILGELVEAAAVSIEPRGIPLPPGVTSVAIAGGLALPLYVLWAAGRAAPAAQRLIAVLGAGV